MLGRDSDYFLELQTSTGWGRTLASFAEWCSPEPGWTTLDIGCGPGLLSAIFTRSGCKAFGIDLDIGMFIPQRLHPEVTVGNVYSLPFAGQSFDLVTASNLLFLLDRPLQALAGMKNLLRPGGKVALLNPSEQLTPQAALEFTLARGMEGVARDTLLNWAKRASEHYHWTEAETQVLYAQAGLTCNACTLKVGPGFARFSSGTA